MVTSSQSKLFMTGLINGLLHSDKQSELNECLRTSKVAEDGVSKIVEKISSGVDVTNILEAV